MLILDVFHPQLPEVEKVKIRQQFDHAEVYLYPSQSVQPNTATLHRASPHGEMSVHVLQEDPLIFVVDNFIAEHEISEVLRLGIPLLEPSNIQQGLSATVTERLAAIWQIL